MASELEASDFSAPAVPPGETLVVQLPQVYVLTWCQRIQLLYGTTLVFKTLRHGFPNSPIHVVDAASIPSAREEIRQSVNSCQADFVQLDRRMELSTFIENVVANQPSGPAVFVDPDICFWQSVEDWQFSGLAAGRLIPRYDCEFTECVTEPRLHTSLLWFPDVARLRAAMMQARQSRRFCEPFRNLMVPMGNRWHFFDTAAGLYGAFPEQMEAFQDRHLEAYDHLFSGSFSDSVAEKLKSEYGLVFREMHRAVQQDHRTLKGSWRPQEQYFQSRAVRTGV